MHVATHRAEKTPGITSGLPEPIFRIRRLDDGDRKIAWGLRAIIPSKKALSNLCQSGDQAAATSGTGAP
jgi:hypothetical protein